MVACQESPHASAASPPAPLTWLFYLLLRVYSHVAHWAIRVDLRTGRVNKSSHIKLPEFRYLWRDFHSKRKIIKGNGLPGRLEPPPNSLCNLRDAHYFPFPNSNKHIYISELNVILTMANIFLNKLPMNYYVSSIPPLSLLVPPYYLVTSSFYRFKKNSIRFMRVKYMRACQESL